MTVAWTYDGASTVVATCTGLLPSRDYVIYGDDPDSTGETATSDGSGNLVLTNGDIGGVSAGDGFGNYVQIAPVGDLVSTAVFFFGSTASGDQGVDVPVTFDGIDLFTLVWPSTNGVDYQWWAGDDSNIFAVSDSFAGDGSTITRQITLVPHGTWVVVLQASSFDIGIKIGAGTPPVGFHICS